MLENKIIGCIGTGNMGSAIISGLSNNIKRENIYCFDIDRQKLEGIKTLYNVNITEDLNILTDKSDIIILAIKPDVLSQIIEKIKKNISDKILVSIAAGISIKSIEDILQTPHKIIRIMPNTPALISEGMAVISPNANVDEKSLLMVKEIFSLLGRILILPEKLMDAVTAVSGCGPAYGFTLIHAMIEGAVKMGIPRNQALILSAQTILGAAKMVLEADEEPMVLRGKVSSPGGSTIEAVHILEKAGFSGIVMDAIEAAKLRSERLGDNN